MKVIVKAKSDAELMKKVGEDKVLDKRYSLESKEWVASVERGE